MLAQAEILDQDEIWIPKSGEPILLADMDDDYCANLIPFLHGNAFTLWERYAPRTDPPDLIAWLESTKLMRYLMRRTEGMDLKALEKRNQEFCERTGYKPERHG